MRICIEILFCDFFATNYFVISTFSLGSLILKICFVIFISESFCHLPNGRFGLESQMSFQNLLWIFYEVSTSILGEYPLAAQQKLSFLRNFSVSSDVAVLRQSNNHRTTGTARSPRSGEKNCQHGTTGKIIVR